jgi:4-hydroxy-tetrahydrodipicolinate synthase
VGNNIFQGTIPALMTPCTKDRQPDFATLARTGRSLIDAGMHAVVYAGSMGDWPLLSDEQRMQGVESLVRAGVPVIVGTGAQSPARAAALAAHAQKVGAQGLMVIPRVLSRGSSAAAQRAHFEGVLAAAPSLPAVIYNSPYYGFETKADLFFDLRSGHRNLVGFKEFSGGVALTYAAEHITGRDPSLTLMVGVDTQVVHGFVNCGARGAITGIGNALPAEVLHLVALCTKAAAGDPVAECRAVELERALAVLSSFDEGADLVLYYKYLMLLAGHPEYELHINAADALSESQRDYANAQWTRFRAWYAAWLPTATGAPATAHGAAALDASGSAVVHWEQRDTKVSMTHS